MASCVANAFEALKAFQKTFLMRLTTAEIGADRRVNVIDIFMHQALQGIQAMSAQRQPGIGIPCRRVSQSGMRSLHSFNSVHERTAFQLPISSVSPARWCC